MCHRGFQIEAAGCGTTVDEHLSCCLANIDSSKNIGECIEVWGHQHPFRVSPYKFTNSTSFWVASSRVASGGLTKANMVLLGWALMLTYELQLGRKLCCSVSQSGWLPVISPNQEHSSLTLLPSGGLLKTAVFVRPRWCIIKFFK